MLPAKPELFSQKVSLRLALAGVILKKLKVRFNMNRVFIFDYYCVVCKDKFFGDWEF